MNTIRHIFLVNSKSLILLVFFFSLWQTQLFSQGLDIQELPLAKRMYVGINILPMQSQIVNKGSDLSMKSTASNVIHASVEFGVFLGRRLGFNVGLGYGTFRELLQLPEASGVFQATDSENDSYEMRWSGSRIEEEQNINYLAIPLGIRYQLPLTSRFACYAKGEMNFCFLLDKSYTSKGIYSYSGYYPAYNVVYSNLPEYGFPSGLNTDIEGDLEINSFRMLGTMAAGISYRFSKNVQISAGAVLMNSFGSVFSSSQSIADRRLTDGPQKINSLMDLGSGAQLKSFGLNFGLTYSFSGSK